MIRAVGRSPPDWPRTCPYCHRIGVLIVHSKSRAFTNGYYVQCTNCKHQFVGFFDKKPPYRRPLI